MIKFYLEQKLHFLGLFLDTNLFRNKKIFHVACFFFEKTSRFTTFLLFNNLGYCFFLFSIGLWINFYYSVLHVFFLEVKLFGFLKIVDIFISKPFGFQFFILFFFIFYQVIFLNTILAYSNKIQLFMKRKYHENILKELHYNSGLGRFTRSLVPAAMTVCIICGKDLMEAYKLQVASNDWKEVALASIEKGQPVPENPVKIVAHTSTSSSTSLDT